MDKELFIDNASREDIVHGMHMDSYGPCMLIQIRGYNEPDFPTPLKHFTEVHKFVFDDTEDITDLESITPTQAKAIASLLMKAKQKGYNIVVHCYAGLCRSGAVVEAAMSIGFKPNPERTRLPNVLVKRMVMTSLGTYITSSTSVFNS